MSIRTSSPSARAGRVARPPAASEEESWQALNSMPALAWRSAPDGSHKIYNRQWHDYTGLPEDGPPDQWISTYHPDDLPIVMESWRQLIASGRPGEAKARIRRFDGEYRWFLLRATPLLDAAGNVIKWYGSYTDIEDLKRAEALLAGEKRLLEMIAKGDPLSVILDALCRVVEELSSQTLASVLLLDQEEQRLRHCASPSLPADYMKAVDQTIIGPCVGSCGTAAYYGKCVFVSDIATDPLWAKYRDFTLSHGLRACWSSPIIAAGGIVLGTLAMYSRRPRDITLHELKIMEQFTHLARIVIERKQAEDALRRSEALLAEGQKITRTGSWWWNLSSGKIDWSAQHLRMFGPRPNHVETKGLMDFAWVHAEDRSRVIRVIGEAIRLRKDYSFEARYLQPGGAVKHVSVTGRYFPGANGDLGYFMGTTADVTEAKVAEEELRRKEASLQQMQAELAHVTRMTTMGEMAASIAHEINQPLGSIVNNSSACLRLLPPGVPDDVRDGLNDIIRDALGASAIISRIRALIKRAPLEKTSIMMQDIVAEVLTLSQGHLAEKRVLVETDLPGDLPPVLGDRVGLYQVLLNLIVNAVEAMEKVPEEHRLIRIHGRREDRDGHPVVVVAVEDSGMGIPAGEEDRIFEAFHTSKPKGTGMGLRISRSIIELLGGRLWAPSNPGAGATFTFYLAADVAGW